MIHAPKHFHPYPNNSLINQQLTVQKAKFYQTMQLKSENAEENKKSTFFIT
jgi:hypothetical protein